LEEHHEMAVGCLLEQAVLAGGATHWQTNPVGSRGQGPKGFCDIVGNVWEWVGTGGPVEYQEVIESASESWQRKAKRMKVACGGGFANYPAELTPYPINDQKLDFFTKVYLERLFGPTRRDYPDQSFWDRGFRVVMARQSN
jgi:formylglycine-generating enzyme required for sulfatase activity